MDNFQRTNSYLPISMHPSIARYLLACADAWNTTGKICGHLNYSQTWQIDEMTPRWLKMRDLQNTTCTSNNGTTTTHHPSLTTLACVSMSERSLIANKREKCGGNFFHRLSRFQELGGPFTQLLQISKIPYIWDSKTESNQTKSAIEVKVKKDLKLSFAMIQLEPS